MLGHRKRGAIDHLPNVHQKIISTYLEKETNIFDYKGGEISASYIEDYYFVSYPRFRLVCSLISSYLPPGSSILEVGPGYGFILLSLKEEGYRVNGAELHENIPAYSKVIQNENIPVYPFNLEIDMISSELSGYDLVIASEVLEHLHISLTTSLGKIASMCRCGGLILITVPNIYRLENYLKVFRRENICEDFPIERNINSISFTDLRTHPREPTMKDLITAVQNNQLEIVQKGYFSSSLKAKHPMISLLNPPPFREHLYLIAKKG